MAIRAYTIALCTLLAAACATGSELDEPQSSAGAPAETVNGSVKPPGNSSAISDDAGSMADASSSDASTSGRDATVPDATATADSATSGAFDAAGATDAAVVPKTPCGAVSVDFDWGMHGAGRCRATIPANATTSWFMSASTDTFVGGFSATCVNGAWEISGEKCAPRGSSQSCFPSGTRCDGSGPAVFPYEHCWTCCSEPSVPIGPYCP